VYFTKKRARAGDDDDDADADAAAVSLFDGDKARSTHRSLYDRVGVVNADP
jgi:hypothetical protein